MIIFPVEIQELFIGQIRDILRIASGLVRIGRIRKQCIQDHSVQNALRRGKRPLHFIIDHSIVLKLSLRRVQFIAPSFLPENLFMLINIRIQHRVHVYMHQILKILVITAGNRIHCLIRIGHRIKKGI